MGGILPAPLAHPLSPSFSARPSPGESASPKKGAHPRGFFACGSRSPSRAPGPGTPAKTREPSGGGAAGGAAGAPARHGRARGGCADRRAPPSHSRLAVCLRGDEDGGGGDGVPCAAEDGQPVSAETGSTPGGGSARPGPAP